jgi:microcompartment protein CcmK/EutM
MVLARIDGMVIATVGHPSLHGCRTVVCQPLDAEGHDEGTPILAIDPLSAGMHERVILSSDGSAARAYVKDEKSPLRNIIVGIVDPPSE